MGKLVIPAIVVLVLVAMGSKPASAKQEPAPEPGPEPGPAPEPEPAPAPPPADTFTPNAAAEATACESAVKDKPESESGSSRGARAWDVWLTWVAFHRAYGRPPTGDPAEAARVAILLSCVRDRLQAEQPKISTKPTPGAWYQIQKGDALFEVSKAAYPGGVSLEGKAPSNYLAARLINEAPENRRFWRMVESEKSLFPKGRITFLPIFGSFQQQRADATSGGEVGAGGGYAVIWIPTPPGP